VKQGENDSEDSCSDCDSDLDLSKELLPIAGYIGSSELLINHMFRSISTKKLKAMLPEILKVCVHRFCKNWYSSIVFMYLSQFVGLSVYYVNGFMCWESCVDQILWNISNQEILEVIWIWIHDFLLHLFKGCELVLLYCYLLGFSTIMPTTLVMNLILILCTVIGRRSDSRSAFWFVEVFVYVGSVWLTVYFTLT